MKGLRAVIDIDDLTKHIYYNDLDLGTIQEENKQLQSQLEQKEKKLQSYKEKEDKLREMFKSEKLENLNKYYYGDSYELDAHELRNDILQILNEGSDTNA